MPARLTPNQKDRLADLGRYSRRLTPSQPSSYSSFAIEAVEGAWVRLSDVGGERTLDHCESKGYAESREEIGPRGGRILFYRPTLAGWDWLVRQERAKTVTPDAPSPAALVPPDPLCHRCKTPDSWHSEDDGQCPDDDGPHYHSAAAYDAREAATKLPALYSEAWPVPYAVAMASREERNANDRSGENVRMALGIVRDATREIFRNAR